MDLVSVITTPKYHFLRFLFQTITFSFTADHADVYGSVRLLVLIATAKGRGWRAATAMNGVRGNCANSREWEFGIDTF
jgi:hypothetical protein